MSHQEAKYLSSLIGTFVVSLVYLWQVRAQAVAGLLEGAEAAALAGRTVLVVIGAVVAFGLALMLAVSAFRWWIGQEIEWQEDERDRLIELRAVNLAFSLFGAGFLAAMVVLALGWPPALVVHLVAGAMLAAGVAADMRRLWHYRRGL